MNVLALRGIDRCRCCTVASPLRRRVIDDAPNAVSLPVYVVVRACFSIFAKVQHLIINKIDLELEDREGYDSFADELRPHIDELETTARSVFGDYEKKLTGISPTSMKDDHIFAVSFPRILEAVYDALHQP